MMGTHRTTVTRDGKDQQIVTYYNTQVAIYSIRSGQHVIKLRHGGFQTVTTKRRINHALRAFGFEERVIQRNGVWYIVPPIHSLAGRTFFDGVTITRAIA